MKKRMILAVLLGVFFFAGTCLADLIKAGDHVYVYYYHNQFSQPYPLQVVAKDGSYSFYTFCIEDEIHLGSSGTEYVVGSISDKVITGGATNLKNPPGYLSYAAAAIYKDYLTYGYKNGYTPNDYQNAIWYAESEIDDPGGNAKTLYDIFANATSYNGILALNLNFLDGSQSQSLMAAVPEPVSMLLFGTGLVGIGGYIRKKFKK